MKSLPAITKNNLEELSQLLNYVVNRINQLKIHNTEAEFSIRKQKIIIQNASHELGNLAYFADQPNS